MTHLLVAGRIHPTGEQMLRDLADQGRISFDYVASMDAAEYIPLMPRADALVIRTQPLTAETIATAPRLRVVSRHGVGYDSVDVAALNARGIGLTILGDVNSRSVAEHAMMLLLAAAKRALRADRAVRNPAEWDWRDLLQQQEIHGKNLLILGYGRIGRHLARMAAGFGLNIRAVNPSLLARGWPEGEVPPTTLDEGLAWADLISVHIPRGSRPAIGAAEIARMKPGVIIVNTARGGVVDEAALAAGLASGHVGAAGVDVFEAEPPLNGSPLFAHDNAILTPHSAAFTLECAERMAITSIGNALAYLDGTIAPDLVVNRDQVLHTFK